MFEAIKVYEKSFYPGKNPLQRPSPPTTKLSSIFTFASHTIFDPHVLAISIYSLIFLIKQKLSIKKTKTYIFKRRRNFLCRVQFSFLEWHFKFIPTNLPYLPTRFVFNVTVPPSMMKRTTQLLLCARKRRQEIITIYRVSFLQHTTPPPATANNNNKNNKPRIKSRTKPSHLLKHGSIAT